jgi:hypothetical protein
MAGLGRAGWPRGRQAGMRRKFVLLRMPKVASAQSQTHNTLHANQFLHILSIAPLSSQPTCIGVGHQLLHRLAHRHHANRVGVHLQRGVVGERAGAPVKERKQGRRKGREGRAGTGCKHEQGAWVASTIPGA